MRLEIRRTGRGTLAAVLNLALTTAAGVVMLGNQWVAAEPSRGGIVAGVLLLAWAGVIASAVLRPVLLVVDDAGVQVRRLFGQHRFGWDALRWVDFSGSRVAIIAAHVDGKDRFAGIGTRAVAAGELGRALAAMRLRRPDLPDKNPETAGTKEAA